MRSATSVPFFPPPWRVRARERTLAVADLSTPWQMTTETGETLTYKSVAEFVALLFDRAIWLYVDRVPTFHLFAQLRAWPGVTIACTKDGLPLQIRIRQGHRTLTVTSSRLAWARLANIDSLTDIRAVHEYVGVPITNTSAAMGMASLIAKYDRSFGIQSRPHAGCTEFIREGMVGGRVDTLVPPSMQFLKAWEADINNAYLNHCQKLPAGTAVWYPGSPDRTRYLPDPPPTMATGYFLCDVTIFAPVPLGLFAMRQPGRTTNYYPSEPGDYRVKLWWHEIEELRRLRSKDGTPLVAIGILEGWYWRSWTAALGKWARTMHRKRLQAPERLAGLIKAAIVAAIGRFGSEPFRYNMTDTPEHGDLPVVDPTLGQLDAWVHAEPADRGELQIHWASYILSRVRLDLFRMALPYAERHQLIATNYDAIWVTVPPRVRPSKGLGRWKVAELHHVSIPAPRQIVADEKTRLPGVPLAGRAPPV